MTYWLLNLVFVAAAAGVALATGRTRKAGTAVVITFAVLCLLTAVFDNLMIASGLFAYRDAQISGWRIGLAPLEDFAYVLAAALLLPALWTLLPAGRTSSRRKDAHDE
ncbi:lycopene cyclase domain-containing protein [Arthrobacter crystallopoietes BAB-32]|uniref:Lycopene cyclase domain-containing protein n=1 Tax=Arthrobacter crystallopoietes BAB-32 TaxID=1246476 RepID=N1UUB9_9MICC|nr:lycopene cyclase domain-containing protein [Arthrobacter crystallopoietes]EMY32650.1 lycopene cyclase domain-containing protein [Arthrobacter crystallopoietes BAB-32]